MIILIITYYIAVTHVEEFVINIYLFLRKHCFSVLSTENEIFRLNYTSFCYTILRFSYVAMENFGNYLNISSISKFLPTFGGKVNIRKIDHIMHTLKVNF